MAALVVGNPPHAFAVAAERLRPQGHPGPGVHPSASVAAGACPAKGVHVGLNAVRFTQVDDIYCRVVVLERGGGRASANDDPGVN